MDDSPLLSVQDLTKHYPVTDGPFGTEVGRVRAVDGISFAVEPGETFGIVGESGCGKSTAAASMLRLEEPTSGDVRFAGESVLEFGDERLRRFRREAQLIFQDPDSSFDPRMSVGKAVAEPLVVQGLDDRERRRRIVTDLFERVGLSADDADRYPHEFSGGQKQRIGLARALAVNPKLLVADEPVSALDVSIQSEILGLLEGFQRDLGLSIVLISHDLDVVRELCDRVAVMYLGEFVEVGPTERLFADPRHPYTRTLLASIPTPDPTDRGLDVELDGEVPDPSAPPAGCRFHTRCPEVIPPESFDLSQSTWRRLLRFRKAVERDAVDLDDIARVGVAEADTYEGIEEQTADSVAPADLARWVREEYDLPASLGDPRAEALVSDALDALVGEGSTDAIDALSEAFGTVCERAKPAMEGVAEDHRVACHLEDDEAPGADRDDRDPGQSVEGSS
jgi:peptide/nickel transport system ATP-binding protein